jgi:hypothetical protein
MELSKNELVTINGGSKSNYVIYIALGGLITFVIGFIDGFLRPLKCNK